MTTRRLLQLLLTACLAGLMFQGVAHAQVVSPGPLNKAHETLEGSENCSKCHGDEDKFAPLCLNCHKDLASRLQNGKGFHGRLDDKQRIACEDCHHDHNGRQFPLYRFGPNGDKDFDHAKTGMPLTPVHSGVGCRYCHKKSLRKNQWLNRASVGDDTWLGLSRACKNCHGEPHRNQFSGKKCLDCHSEALRPGYLPKWKTGRGSKDNAWLDPPGFDHSKTVYPLEGLHRKVTCRKCHKEDGDKNGSFVRYNPVAHKQCQNCHKNPHNEKTSSARRLFADCSSCHSPAKSFRKPSLSNKDHTAAGIPLQGAHRLQKCRSCHRGKTWKQRHPKITMTDCATCHTPSPHAPNYKRCQDCHNQNAFVPSTMATKDHPAAFPLKGGHLLTPCRACHKEQKRKGSKKLRKFPLHLSVKQGCESCHKNPHSKQFDVGTVAGRCTGCHTVADWYRTTFDHNKTGFDLTGKHAQVACHACHKAGALVRQSAEATSVRPCSSCHFDPHYGQFERQSPVKHCDACHNSASFKLPSFDHKDKTGWPLLAAHKKVACRACHRNATSKKISVVLFRGTSKNCTTCHQTPHQFTTPKCADCHRPNRWTDVSKAASAITGFDHDKQTEFPLTGAHQNIRCAACHFGPQLSGRSLRCDACHQSQHKRIRQRDCGLCHETANWQPMPNLEAHAESIFPLLGAHRTAPCEACHRTGLSATPARLPQRCSACHRQEAVAAGVHPDHRRASFRADCAFCHNESAWRPAIVQHDRFWLLEGGHRRAACNDCHTGGRFARTPTRCYACHRARYEAAKKPDHKSQVYPTVCEQCHRGANSWNNVTVDFHDSLFPISSGKHAGLACADCHPDGTRSFSCLTCHEHSKSQMDSKHLGKVSDYRYESRACLRCHPSGQAGD